MSNYFILPFSSFLSQCPIGFLEEYNKKEEEDEDELKESRLFVKIM